MTTPRRLPPLSGSGTRLLTAAERHLLPSPLDRRTRIGIAPIPRNPALWAPPAVAHHRPTRVYAEALARPSNYDYPQLDDPRILPPIGYLYWVSPDPRYPHRRPAAPMFGVPPHLDTLTFSAALHAVWADLAHFNPGRLRRNKPSPYRRCSSCRQLLHLDDYSGVTSGKCDDCSSPLVRARRTARLPSGPA